LFPLTDLRGRSSQIGRKKFTVIGTLARRSSDEKESGIRKSPNMTVYMPLNTGLQKLGSPLDPQDLDEIVLRIEDDANLKQLESLLRRVLARRHNNAVDYSITIPELLLQQKQATQRIFSVVLLFIPGLSLLVGGIGIMNI